jgi:Domain of unknown function (DUF4159)
MQRRRLRRRLVVPIAAVMCALTATVASAQFGRGGFFGFGAGRIATPQDFDGRFHYCRIVYRQSPDGQDGSWRTDYPRADINFSIRFSELTRTNVSFNARHEPNHLLVNLGGPELFDCPVVILSAPGAVSINDAEGSNLRTYLLKGGFLWADDFWGTYEWDHWVREIRHALPADEYPIFDIPPEHPILRTQFEVSGVTQIPNIGFYMRSGGRTSEQGTDSAMPHLRAIADRSGRIMVLITHNTDVGDSWEREGDDPGYFMAFGPKGYALGINAFLYALTH